MFSLNDNGMHKNQRTPKARQENYREHCCFNFTRYCYTQEIQSYFGIAE